MKNKNDQSMPAAELRKRAEEIVGSKTLNLQETRKNLSQEETSRLLHELQVHQIELEMQNEELRRTQAELEAARDRYVDLYDLAPVGYCTLSEKGQILQTNLTAATMLGVTRSLLVKQPLAKFIVKDDKDTSYRHLKQLFETGEPQTYELRMLRQDGTQFWAHLGQTAKRNADGSLVCRIVINDISVLKQTEEELRKNQKQLRDAHRLAHIGIWNWIADTDSVTWTEELYRIAGLNPMMPAPTYEEHHNLYTPESWNRLQKSVEKALETGEPYQLELELMHTDGITRIVNAYGGAMHDEQGRATGLYGTVQDITERKRTENGRQIFQDRLTRAQEIAHVGSWEYNLETGQIWGSEEAVRIYGFSETERFAERRVPLLPLRVSGLSSL